MHCQQPGQINLHTPLGRELRDLASRPEYDTFLEFGTWNGRGSTECILCGLEAKGSGTVWTVESDPYMSAVATQTLKRRHRARLLKGRVSDDFMTLDEMRAHPLYKAECEEWYAGEYARYLNARVLSPRQFPVRVDVVVIDGGEFSTRGDWRFALTRGPKVVVLDDINAIKCRDIYESLRSDPESWHLVRHSDQGTGWAIFRRVPM